MVFVGIWHEEYALTTAKEAYKLIYFANYLKDRKMIKKKGLSDGFDVCLMDLKMRRKLDFSDIEKEIIFSCIQIICLSELCPSSHFS